jgi:hypothetical protein
MKSSLVHFLSALAASSSSAFAFAPTSSTSTSIVTRFGRTSSIITIMHDQKPAGSFFNQVPPESDDDNDNDNDNDDDNDDANNAKSSSINSEASEPLTEKDPFDQSIEQLMKNRRSKPRASNPSTIGGIPTSKATGKLFIF